MASASGRIINKQIKLTKQMTPNIKQIILANMNVKFYGWHLLFATDV